MDNSAISEEIALEGLDGITLNTLWKRLEDRPDFDNAHIDDNRKQYFWKYICSVRDLSFYILPEPRHDFAIFKYSDQISVEGCKCILSDNIPPDIYSHKSIDQDGVKGCCDHYESRKNVTDEVRNSDGSCQMSLNDVIERWGQCFVIVASQRQRNLVLLGSTMCPLVVGAEIFCILESVGRSRYDGEITQCRYARGLYNPIFSKLCQTANVFARVKLLVKFGYVTKQPFTLKYDSPAVITQVRIVHLQRFYRETTANYRRCFQALNDYLMEKPNKSAVYADALNDLNLKFSLFKKRSLVFNEHFTTAIVNYTELFSEELDLKAKTGKERKVRIVRLIKPYGGEDDDDDDDEEDGDDYDDCEESHKAEADIVEDSAKTPEKQNPAPILANVPYDQPLLSHSVLLIKKSGEKGLLQSELMSKLNVNKYMARGCIKDLLKKKLIACVKRAIWRNSANVFVSPEVAERLKEVKMVDDIKPEPAADSNTVTMVDEASSFEETSLCPSADTQELENEGNSLEFQINNISVSCTLDRAKIPIKPVIKKKEDNDKKWARRKFVLKQLAEKKVFNCFRSIYLEICKEEKRQGLKEHMCHKSLRRIIKDLYDEGLLCYVNVHEKSKPDKPGQQIMIDPSMTLEDSRVKKAILQSSSYYMRLDGKGVPQPGNQIKQDSPAKTSLDEPSATQVLPSKPFNNKPVQNAMVSVCQMLDKRGPSLSEEQTKYVKSKRSSNDQVPKFERAKLLHKYMFYRLYGYEGRSDMSTTETVDESQPEGPPVYLDVDDWRRHLPPLKKHNEAFLSSAVMDGACMIGDILLHMPICLFYDAISISWMVEGLDELLNDPVKKNYPLTAVPQEVLKRLLTRRTYMFKLNDSLLTLCQLGLLTFGTKTSSRELEFISFYLHKKAIVLDTRKSKPGNLMTSCPEGEAFDQWHYNFKSMSDVDTYWNDVKIICLDSKLGSYSVVDVKGNHGTTSLLEAIHPIPLQDVNEDNWLPGDHRGGAGFDSSLFIHRVSSWVNKGNRGKQKSSVMLLSLDSKKSEVGDIKPTTSQKEEGPPAKKRKISRAAHSAQPSSTLLKKYRRANKPMKRVKMGLKKKEKGNTEDDVDRQAKLHMRKQRVYFTPIENGMLLLSQVASCILSPKTSACVRSSLIRDILQELLPESKDKTTRAVKGKMARLLKEEKFRLHLVSYIAQAQSDKNLMENYTKKKYAILSQEIENQFRRLHQDLRNKFSSPKHFKAIPLPPSIGELLDHYEVKNTMDILYKSPKMSKVIHCVDDIKELVVWELLESLLHLTKPLSSRDIYYTLSRFPEDVIDKAYVGLKTCAIFVQMKKSEKDTHQIINRSALLNNHKSTLRHRDALKSRYPTDLFSNLKAQIDSLEMIKTTQLTLSESGKIQDKLALQSTMGQPEQTNRPSENKLNPDSVGLMDTELLQVETEPGTSTSDTQHRSKVGMKSIDEVNEDLQEKRVGAADVDNCNNDEMLEDNEADYKELNVKKFQGGSVLTVISLLAKDQLSMKLVIPDEMVKLDEEGKRQLYFKQPRDEQQRKRKHDVIVDTDEDSNDEWTTSEKGTSSFQHRRTGQKLSNRGLRYPKVYPSAMKINDPACMSSSMAETEKCLKFKNVTLKMRCLKNAASGVLENFTVWVASGSLLTIARTSLIESLDLLNSKCLLQRNFVVEPLDMKFALKQTTCLKPQARDFMTKKPNSDNAEYTQKEKGDMLVDSVAPESRSDLLTGSVPAKDPQNRTSSKDISRSMFSEESCMDIIYHLEKCFSPDLINDDMGPLLGEILPAEFLKKGLSLYELIDRSGELGITEIDLEMRLSSTMQQIKPILMCLVRADTVFKVGLTQRSFVSRRHVKVWFVEVPAVSESRHISHGNDDTHDDGRAAKKRSCSSVYQCHMWRHFNGSLNSEGLQTVLQRIMTYLMIHPGCSLSRLCHVFNPDLLPATTMDAIDILEGIGCVELFRIQKANKSSLFSARRCLNVGDDISLEECVTAVNLTIDAPVKLAFFLDLTAKYCQGK